VVYKMESFGRLSNKPETNRPKTNKQRREAAAKASKSRKAPSASQKGLINLAGNLQRQLAAGDIKGKAKKDTVKAVAEAMEGYSMKDIKQLQRKQNISPITIGALKKAKLLSNKDSDSGLLGKAFGALKDSGSFLIEQIQRPQQAIMSGIGEYVRDSERSGNWLSFGDVGSAALKGFTGKKYESPTSIIRDWAKIRKKQGEDTDILGIDYKTLTTGALGVGLDIAGSVATDPLTYLTLGGTAAARAAVKKGSSITRTSLMGTNQGHAAAAKFSGHMRGGGSVESFAKGLSDAKQISPAAAAKLQESLKAGIGAKAPNMRRGIRINPMGIPFKKTIQKLGVRATGGKGRIDKALKAGRITPEQHAGLLGATRGERVKGAIGDIRAKKKIDIPLGSFALDRGLRKLTAAHPGLTGWSKGNLNALSKTAKADTSLMHASKEVLAQADAAPLALEQEAKLLANSMDSASTIAKDIATDETNYIFRSGVLYKSPFGKAGRIEVVKPRQGLSQLDIDKVGDYRAFYQRNLDFKKGAGVLEEAGPNARITRERYGPHILKKSSTGKVGSGRVPAAIRNREYQGSVKELNEQLLKGEYTDLKGNVQKIEGFDPKNPMQFETDPGKIVKGQTRNEKSFVEQVAITKGLKREGILVQLDEAVEAPAGHFEIAAPASKDATSMHTLFGVQPGKKLYLPQTLKDDFDKLAQIFGTEKSGILRGYDKFLALWKGYATVPFPLSTGFTLRNALGNYIANYMEGSITLSHYASAMRLEKMGVSLGAKSTRIAGDRGNLAKAAILRGNRTGAVDPNWANGLLKKYPILRDKKWTKNDIEMYHDAVQNGIVSKQFSYLEAGAEGSASASVSAKQLADQGTLTQTIASKGVGLRGLPRRGLYDKLPTRWQKLASGLNLPSRDNYLLRAGTKFNSAIENNARFAHFIAKREQGLSVFDAGASTRKYLFDYNDLSNFERQVFKRVSPFYTFTRKSIPLYAEMLVTNPGKFNRIGYVQKAIADTADYQAEDVPEWMKQARGVPLPMELTDAVAKIPLLGRSFKKGTPAVLIPDLPYKNLLTLADLIGGFPKNPTSGDQIRTLSILSGIGGPAGVLPLLYQMAAGKNLFTGASIDDSVWVEAPVWAKRLPGPLGKPLVEKKIIDAGGKKVDAVKQKDVFFLESLLPLLGKLRTIPGFSTSKKDLAAAGRRGLSMLTGLSAYPIDAATKGTAYKSDTEKLRLRSDENKGLGLYAPRTPYVRAKKGPQVKMKALTRLGKR